MTSQEFGELIRVNREQKGLSIEELAARFKLSASTLRSIENGSLENLPHAVYARGFVRSYAQAVGVHPDDLESGIEALFPQHLFEDVPTPPAPLNSKPVKAGKSAGDKLAALLVLLVVIAVPLGIGWFVYTNYGDDIAEMVKKPFSAMPSSSPAPAGNSQEPDPPVSSAGTSSGPASVTERRPQPQPPAVPPEPPAQQRAETPPAAPPVTSAAPAPQQPVPAPAAEETVASTVTDGKSVSLQATEECWVEVTVDGGGTRSFTIFPGETSLLPYKKKITIVLGNAGGVTVLHNDQPYPVTGKRNEKKTLTFQ